MKSEKGFTLLEVVASFVIISIILLSFYPMLNSAKKASNSNTERLVVINLAEATLNRLKKDEDSYIDKVSEIPNYLFSQTGSQLYTLSTCESDVCKNIYAINLNNRDYFFEVTASQDEQESESKLINIIVTAKNQNGSIKYSVEGYISYE